MSHTHSNEFTSDNLHVVLSIKPHCQVEMRIKTVPSLFEKARLEGSKIVGKQVTLPGFRKGKASPETIAQKFPKDVEKETHTALADMAFQEAMALTNVRPLNRSSKVVFDLKKIDDTGAELIFTFETEPTIPHVDPKQCILKPAESTQPTEKQVNEAIRQAQFFFADWKEITERPVQEGDYLLIDLDTIEGDVVERVFTKVRFEVSKERMAEWMQKLVIGAKIGDVVEGLSELDAEATEEEKKNFQPKKTRVSIVKIEETILPALDDEFAKKLRVDNVQAMQNSITQMLHEQLKQKVHEEQRSEILTFLAETYPFEIPQSLLNAEIDHRKNNFFRDAQFKKSWDTKSPEEQEDFLKNLRLEAANAVRLFYLSRQIVRENNLGITHKEVQDIAVQLLQREGKQRPISPDAIPQEIRALALSKVILAHAQDYIIRACQEEKQS